MLSKLNFLLVFLVVMGWASTGQGEDQNITTVAGSNGECCPIPPANALLCNDACGDGGPAISAKLRRPFGVWVEPNGDLYIADTVNHRIRKVVAATGIIDTIAGNRALGRGTSGLGGNALLAQLFLPSAVAVRDGEVYIIEGTGGGNGPSRVTKIDLDGNLVLVAGTGVGGFSGDGGPATAAQIGRDGGSIVFGVADDSIYITDPFNGRIRRIDPNGNMSTAADFFAFGIPANVGLAIDPGTGDLYATLPVQGNVAKVAAGPDGIVSGAALDPNETTSIVPGVTGVTGLNFPTYLDIVDDNLIIADQNNHRVKQFDLIGEMLSLLAGTVQGFSGDGDSAINAKFNFPDGLTHQENGNLFIADRQNSRIRVLTVKPTLMDIGLEADHAVAYLEFPEEAGHGVEDVDVSTVTVAPQNSSSVLLDVPLPALASPTSVGDGNNNGVPDRMVTFDRQTVAGWIALGGIAQLRIDGRFFPDGRYFSSADDNCPFAANADQLDTDGDGAGDACDEDDDNDGVNDEDDNCPLLAGAPQTDTDEDGAGDACDEDDDNDGVNDEDDNCPLAANEDQSDTDEDGAGDACDEDDDNDGVLDGDDNCPLASNQDQKDTEGDGTGDACDTLTPSDCQTVINRAVWKSHGARFVANLECFLLVVLDRSHGNTQTACNLDCDALVITSNHTTSGRNYILDYSAAIKARISAGEVCVQ